MLHLQTVFLQELVLFIKYDLYHVSKFLFIVTFTVRKIKLCMNTEHFQKTCSNFVKKFLQYNNKLGTVLCYGEVAFT